MDVMTAQSVAQGERFMTTFTIDAENSITAYPTPDHAEAAVGAGAQPFTSQQQLAQLAAAWPVERLLAIWNSFAGVAGFGADLKPVQKFTDRKTAIKRIWTAIQKLAAVPQTSEAAAETAAPKTSDKPAAVPTEPKAAKKAKGSAQAAKGAPAKDAPKAKKAAKLEESAGPREGSKTAQVVAMLHRKNGATLAEIMEKMGWQKHTVRGFMAGAMKKAGYAVESFKPEGGERTYRIGGK
jgi:hypothetical protein